MKLANMNTNELVVLKEMVTKALNELGVFSVEELDNAMSSRTLYDLEDLIDLQMFEILKNEKQVINAHKNDFGYKVLIVDNNEYTIQRALIDALPLGAIIHDKYIEIEHLEIDYINNGYSYSELDTCQDLKFKTKNERGLEI